jgi:hypothetical protein
LQTPAPLVRLALAEVSEDYVVVQIECGGDGDHPTVGTVGDEAVGLVNFHIEAPDKNLQNRLTQAVWQNQILMSSVSI